MGITRCGRHKKSNSGAKRNKMQKKRKNMMGRQPSNTKIGETRVKALRVRGGNYKQRALRLNSGEFLLKSGNMKANVNIEQVIYHPSNNDLVRTNTLTKSSVVKIAAEPFVDEINKLSDERLSNLADKGFVYGIVTSRPGQVGCANGYVLQGEELVFYQSKLKKGNVV
ncbi:RS8B [Hepatospora eriocheir]|uniref:40S ribosomal protein S8 n=2 Tax=Hepatospora eriocheir TaxID=1081669 RepID=A0A1X0QIZ8_9MICR|nr:RS8B [Hepatospora eriocheir]